MLVHDIASHALVNLLIGTSDMSKKRLGNGVQIKHVLTLTPAPSTGLQGYYSVVVELARDATQDAYG